MDRIHSLDGVIGHTWVMSYFRQQLAKNLLPHFIILEGPEGVGKTTIADLVALELVYGSDNSTEKTTAASVIIDNKSSNDYIKKFECSVEGGKPVAMEILEEMRSPFRAGKRKVIICDECHRFTPNAQDVILSNTEYLNDSVYVFMMTTDISMLQSALKSRAFIIKLPTLTQKDMLCILRSEAQKRSLNIQAETATLTMIAEWAEYKPRTGLKILEGFGSNASVSADMIRGLIGILDVSDVLPLLTTLAGSLTAGLAYINEMPIHDSFISIVSEIVLIKSGGVSYKIKLDDLREVRKALREVSKEQLVRFLEGITRYPAISRSVIINAYINAHVSKELIFSSNSKESL